jgi:hypothetical protein
MEPKLIPALLLLCGLALLVVGAGGHLIFALWKKAREYVSEAPARAAEDAAMSIVEASLLLTPQEWRLDPGGHRLYNQKRGLCMWVANKDYGLSVHLGNDALPASDGRGFQMRPYWRKRLYVAVQARMAQEVVAKFSEGE